MKTTLRTREERTPNSTSPPWPAAPAASVASLHERNPSADDRVRRRIRTLVGIAAANGSTISTEELRILLPTEAFASAEGVGQFLREDPVVRSEFLVLDGEVAPKGKAQLIARRQEQRRLTSDRLALADRFVASLDRCCPWIELVAISGSVAYGGTKPHDDVDFFLVTQRNRMWISLLAAMSVGRLERMRDPNPVVFCFNRVTEREACESSFRTTREPLFAREALNLRILRGHEFYTNLLQSAPWMAQSFPGLYREKVVEGFSWTGPKRTTPAPHAFLANGVAFLLLAPYLWLMGLTRNARLHREGRKKASFRTIIEWSFCAFESKKYDDLREDYRRSF